MLCKSYERGTRPVAAAPQTELEFLGESDREVNWGITWEVYSSLRYHWALGLAACENFLSECSEVGVMEPGGDFHCWVDGRLRLVLHPLLH